MVRPWLDDPTIRFCQFELGAQHNTASQSYEEQLAHSEIENAAHRDEDAIEIAQSISSGWLQTSPFSVFLCELLTSWPKK